MQENNTNTREEELTDLARILTIESRIETPLDFVNILIEYDRYILKYPDVLTAYVNRANVLEKLGLYQLALSDVEYVLKINNEFDLAWCHRFFINSLYGRYGKNWGDFEWRFKSCVKDSTTDSWPVPRWNGEELNGDTLCICAEQGLGDNIQFVRYAIEAKKRGMNIIVNNRKPLDRLLHFNLKKYDIPVMGYTPSVSNVAYYAHMMSFPYYFNTEIDTVPHAEGYIEAEPDYIEKWKQLIQAKNPASQKLKVGIVWSGSLDHGRHKFRNIPFEKFKPLLQLDAEFHCLQKEISEQDIKQAALHENLYLWNDQIGDYSDTAGLISQLDLVISVDTSVAHLAGAMAKPTWIMITYHPDYRWLLNRDDSPWYHSVRLFRQDLSMSWDPVIGKVAKALQEKMEIKS